MHHISLIRFMNWFYLTRKGLNCFWILPSNPSNAALSIWPILLLQTLRSCNLSRPLNHLASMLVSSLWFRTSWSKFFSPTKITAEITFINDFKIFIGAFEMLFCLKNVMVNYLRILQAWSLKFDCLTSLIFASNTVALML